ncbi:MAG: ABC transporter permease [Sphaerochaeta sp.]
MDLIITALELGLMSSLTVLALFLSYSMLGVCDLSTDGCFTFGAAVGAIVALAGHPYLAVAAAMGAGALSGLVTAVLQTKMGVDSLLSGIVVNTGLYSVNIAVMGNTSLLNMNKTETIFTKARDFLSGTMLAAQYKMFVIVIAAALAVLFLAFFLKTRAGLAIRATGDNPDMVRSSSIDPSRTTIIGLCIANTFTGLSGCLLVQYQKSVNVTIGSGMLTIALASLLIGGTFMGKTRSVTIRALGAVLGAFIFRLVYTAALRLNMPAFMLKLVSSVIVVLAISGPYLRRRFPLFMRMLSHSHRAYVQGDVNADVDKASRMAGSECYVNADVNADVDKAFRMTDSECDVNAGALMTGSRDDTDKADIGTNSSSLFDTGKKEI